MGFLFWHIFGTQSLQVATVKGRFFPLVEIQLVIAFPYK